MLLNRKTWKLQLAKRNLEIEIGTTLSGDAKGTSNLANMETMLKGFGAMGFNHGGRLGLWEIVPNIEKLATFRSLHMM